MKRDLSQYIVQKNGSNKFSRHWRNAAIIMAIIVTFCTTYALILPAITMSHKLICGKEEHEHTDECYKIETVYSHTELECALMTSMHTHSAECCNEENGLICGQADFIVHDHDDRCFDAEGRLICQLPVVKEHKHSDECYDEENNLICEEAETELHTHIEKCRDENGEFICGKPEIKEHRHDEACVVHETDPTEKKVLVCDKEVHVHGDECYGTDDPYYYCGLSEHKHHKNCYNSDGVLNCGKKEHTHSEECYSSQSKALTYSDSQMQAELYLLGDNDISSDAELVITPITKITDPESYALMMNAIEAGTDSGRQTLETEIYDVKIYDNGEPKELPSGATAVLDAKFSKPVFSADAVKESANIKAYALTASDDSSDAVSAEELADEYQSSDLGITGVTLTMNELSPFAVTLAGVNGRAGGSNNGLSYWQKVSSIDSESASYLIVSQSGEAFGISSNGYSYSSSAQSVSFNAVASHDDCYSSNAIDDAYQWNIVSSGNGYKLSNVSYPTRYLRLSSNTVISTNGTSNTLTYRPSSNSFRISYNGYYMRYYNGSFSRSTSTTGADLTIYKAIDDPTGSDTGTGTVGTGGGVTKPDYGEFITPSDKKSGEHEENGVTVKYASDPSTSQIESQFRDADYDDSKKNDGKVITDKSVIYMGDDYNAFSNYDQDTFGVTLSALGQQFDISGSYEVSTPLDVVFVLDASGSMIINNAGNITRAEAMVTAVNSTMKTIYDLNPDNRVGVVAFSGAGTKLLELGRYSAPNNEYLTMSNYSSRTGTLKPNTGLASSDGKTYRGAFSKWQGTYTQHGIATGADILINEADTTYTGSIDIYDDNGDFAGSAPYTVKRKPLIILVSDGDPTYCNSAYDKVLTSNSTIYGDGVATSTANNKGILGYYTVLTANYCKNQISAHYGTVASFYTIGMGINSTGTASSDNSLTGDHYKRAVLNPTQANINALNNNRVTNASTTAVMLYQLLHNTYKSGTVTVSSAQATSENGLPANTKTNVPVVKNPYINTGYSYAERALVDTNITAEDLKAEFEEIIRSNADLEVYAFILKSGTSVKITDSIGDGMEIKGAPVLRYWGKEFHSIGSDVSGNVTTYNYEGSFTSSYIGMTADMSEMKVKVTDNTDGSQTVEFFVPYKSLPVYSPNVSGGFYYEALPVRLIYQVGLTDKARAEIEQLRTTGGELDYYVGKWSEDHSSFSDLDPTPENPYYQATGGFYNTVAKPKTDNATNTAANYWIPYTEQDKENCVGHYLGNNGVLRFLADASVKKITIPVEKKWDAATSESSKTPVTLRLYRSVDNGVTVEEVNSVVLSNENDWKGEWIDIDSADEQGNEYKFFVAEEKLDGFNISYSGATEKILVNGSSINAAVISTDADNQVNTVIVTNTPGSIVLPLTGGGGTHMYTLAGALIVLSAAGLYIILRLVRKYKLHSRLN